MMFPSSLNVLVLPRWGGGMPAGRRAGTTAPRARVYAQLASLYHFPAGNGVWPGLADYSAGKYAVVRNAIDFHVRP
jgi:hypothetical protein